MKNVLTTGDISTATTTRKILVLGRPFVWDKIIDSKKRMPRTSWMTRRTNAEVLASMVKHIEVLDND